MKTLMKMKISFMLEDKIWDRATDAILDPFCNILSEVISDPVISIGLKNHILTLVRGNDITEVDPELVKLARDVKIEISDF